MTVLTLLAAAALGLLSLLWLLLVAGAVVWAREYRLDGAARPEVEAPSLSVCIPARDEAGRIGPCVAAALALDYEPLEVVVVDDRSRDGTGDEARAAGAGDERLRVLEGCQPLGGFAGKPWACLAAADAAGGELLLFVDADVRLAPWAAAAAVAHLEREELALLSLFGDWELVGWWEKVVVPVVGWFIRGAVQLPDVNDPAGRTAFANGQFILVRRDAYEDVGGHGAVRSDVLDDVRLALAFRRAGEPLGMLHAPGAFSVRLYDSLGAIVRGYAKNLYEGMGRRRVLGVAAVLGITCTTLLPWALLALLPLAGAAWPWTAWTGAICAAMLVYRWRRERADGRSGLLAGTHPLGNVVFVWILLRSMLGGPAEWKGRRFVAGKAAGGGDPEP